jgi:quercetin dioxygenase-like cupin family protein
MPLIRSSTAPTFELPALSVLGLAAPSRGARETCVWRITLAPGSPAVPHSVDREEIFVALAGEAQVMLGEEETALTPGDTLIVPAGQSFSLSNPGAQPFSALAVLPVGGRAVLPGGAPFPPPWVL